MPVYEYRCTQCEHLFERYQAVGEAAPECPGCGSPSRKVFRSVGLIFKGSGFHTTDYRKSGNGEKPPSTEGAAAGASTTASSTPSSGSSKSSAS
ncbi:MAG: zinc ribbon domain-containing protein [Armatimonadota bacterium]|nr:zinc ribbon domain-containing protein [Armatimonadota bacterium]